MEIRKVQVTGGSSFVITLPKEWIKSLNIKKNDSLGLIVQSDGTLLITPRIAGEPSHRVKEFTVDNIDDPEYVFRLLVGAYIMGYSSIVVRSPERIPPFVMDCVARFTQTAVGPEIIEETMDSITVKDLLNPVEMPFEKTIKRMSIILKTMHEDAITALRDRNRSMAEDVMSRDNNVDRLQWLVARQSNLVLQNVTLARKMGVTQEEATYYFLISRIMERIGDHAVRIAENVSYITETALREDVVESIGAASTLALEILSKSMKAWTRRDINAANRNIEEIEKLISRCEEVNNNALNIKGRSSISIGYIAESIKRTGEYAADIAELVINHLVNEE
ncbi:MAG: phosphate uptake regulator PhoU [Theionarchaea archaeon]|nr:phosphate uptake regulator PhoU [Theionarchaea archaeon]MBU7022146.1 phosphate uptake regulator PhoU [Theionarchaea archaeon]MBU7040185.1 phosphate uptake regulator PhoU [Theionarchaea archaeon]